MAESLRDQLLKSGLVKEVREEKRNATPARQGGGVSGQRPQQGGASGQPYAGSRPNQGGRPPQAGKSAQAGRSDQGNGSSRGGRPNQNGSGQGGKPNQGNASNQSGRQNQGGRSGQANGSNAGASRPPRKDGEIDLAKAYAIRAQTESAERRRVEAEAAELARQRKEKKRQIEELLKGKSLNLADVDQVRHFPYGDKIRRVHVDAAQLVAINAGELGVVQQAGRYIVVDKTVIEALRAIGPEFIALMVDPNAVSESDDGVPDDLMW